MIEPGKFICSRCGKSIIHVYDKCLLKGKDGKLYCSECYMARGAKGDFDQQKIKTIAESSIIFVES